MTLGAIFVFSTKEGVRKTNALAATRPLPSSQILLSVRIFEPLAMKKNRLGWRNLVPMEKFSQSSLSCVWFILVFTGDPIFQVRSAISGKRCQLLQLLKYAGI